MTKIKSLLIALLLSLGFSTAFAGGHGSTSRYSLYLEKKLKTDNSKNARASNPIRKS